MSRTPLLRLLSLARPYAGWMLLAGLVSCITVLASVGLMAVAGWFIASMAIAGATTGMMNYFLPAAGIRLFAILRTGGRYLDRLVSHEATFRLLGELRLWLFRRLMALPPAALEDRRGADLATSLQADIETLQHAYLRLGAPVAVAVACSVLAVALLALLFPPAALVLAALLLCAGGIVPAVARRAAAAPGAAAVAERAALRSATVDFIQGATDLRAAGAQARALAALSRQGAALAEAQRQAAVHGAFAEAAVTFCAWLAVWGSAVLAAGAVAAGTLAPPLVPALALAALAAFEAVAPLPGAMQRWGEVTAAARRLFALADRPAEPAPPPEASPVPRDGSLAFREVRLCYPAAGAPALDGVDLSVPDGCHLAILGPSGAGKSSLVRLLLRLQDYEGTITLGGHDLRRYRPEDARRLVGYAAQSMQLFNATVRDNLRLAAPGADEDALWRALATAGLDAMVRGLPEGLDAWIGEGGARLSAGEARRLVIARTLLRDPLVLVLDEPTENLDATTGRSLLARIGAARRGRTTLLITHDPVAARAFADVVARLEGGRCADGAATGGPDPD